MSEALKGNDYAKGSKRSDEQKKEQSGRSKRMWEDQDLKEKASERMKGNNFAKGSVCSARERQARSERLKKKWEDPNFREKAIRPKDHYRMMVEKSHTKENRLAHSEFMKGNKFTKGHKFSLERKLKHGLIMKRKWQDSKHRKYMCEVLSEAQKKKWQDPVHRETQIKAIMDGLYIIPNRPERVLFGILNSLFPGEWEFTGDGQKKQVCGKAPDFQPADDRKLIIEMFGDYWHTRPGSKERDVKRIRLFEKNGYKTLVVWDTELKDTELLKFKLKEFACQPS